MTDREKLEKVIKRLEQFITDFKPFCGNKADWQKIYDAIVLLKAQEPRVMTLEEAQGEDEVWFEFRPSNVGRYADCYMHDVGDKTRVYFTGKAVMSLFENSEYGKTWRCWTSRPTDEQREAVKWDE